MMSRLFLILLLFAPILAVSQAAPDASVEARLERLLHYIELEVPQDTLNQWVEWVKTGEAISETVPDRNAAWKRFLLSLYHNLGSTPNELTNSNTLAFWSQYLTYPMMMGRIMDLKQRQQPKSPATVISTSGSGKTPLVLIPALGFSARSFEVFEDRYQDVFRFIRVSYPSGENALPYPETASHIEAPWLNHVELVLKKHLDKAAQEPVLIMASGSGLYTALRFALLHPQMVKGIVSIDGQYMRQLIHPETGMPATRDQRNHAAKRDFPLPSVIQFSPGIVARNFALTQDEEKNDHYLSEITPEAVNSIFRYSQEYGAQDLTTNMPRLQTPVLALVAEHDDASPIASSRTVMQSWQELRLMFPELPISIVPIPDSRSLCFLDQPALFDHYFQAFAENPALPIEPLGAKPMITQEHPSPEAAIEQVIATTHVAIRYARPAKRQRAIFGTLVPFGEVWRAGANEATVLEVSNDVLIEGQLLSAGSYSLFFLPGEDQWELILNKVSVQWGAFKYNPHFDALRVNLEPAVVAETQEYLEYRFEHLSEDGMHVSMVWDSLKVGFDIKEHFELPHPPETVRSLPWKLLLSDPAGDGVNPGMSDGKALSYALKNDSLWFKFDLHEYNNQKAFALNVLFDTDNDQTTGSPWFGTNTSFTFDLGLTLWMRKSGVQFAGTNGIMLPKDFTSGNRALKAVDNIIYYLDPEQKMYIAGLAIKDLELHEKTIRVIGAVGEYETWNDDIGDTQSATISLD